MSARPLGAVGEDLAAVGDVEREDRRAPLADLARERHVVEAGRGQRAACAGRRRAAAGSASRCAAAYVGPPGAARSSSPQTSVRDAERPRHRAPCRPRSPAAARTRPRLAAARLLAVAHPIASATTSGTAAPRPKSAGGTHGSTLRRCDVTSFRDEDVRIGPLRVPREPWPDSQQPPYGAYAVLVAVYSGGLATAGLLGKLLGRSAYAESALDLAVLSAASFKAARTIARDEVTSFARQPFVEGEAHTGEGEEPVHTGGMQQAIGELVTCTRCIGTWTAAGLTATQILAPRFGRMLTWSLARLGRERLPAGRLRRAHREGERARAAHR